MPNDYSLGSSRKRGSSSELNYECLHDHAWQAGHNSYTVAGILGDLFEHTENSENDREILCNIKEILQQTKFFLFVFQIFV